MLEILWIIIKQKRTEQLFLSLQPSLNIIFKHVCIFNNNINSAKKHYYNRNFLIFVH